MNILHVFDQAFEALENGKIDNIYITVDIHDTIFKGYVNEIIWLGKAKECLEYISNNPIFKLVIWSGSTSIQMQPYIDELNKYQINYIGINENDGHCKNVRNKLYTNILIDDRAGFEADKDWEIVLNYLIEKFNGINR